MRVLISTLALLFIAGCASFTGKQHVGASETGMTDASRSRVMAQSEAKTVRAGGKTVYAQGRR